MEEYKNIKITIQATPKGLWNMKSCMRILENQIHCFSLHLISAKTLMLTLSRPRQNGCLILVLTTTIKQCMGLCSPNYKLCMSILILCGLTEATCCRTPCLYGYPIYFNKCGAFVL